MVSLLMQKLTIDQFVTTHTDVIWIEVGGGSKETNRPLSDSSLHTPLKHDE